jgi:hypothetical protein
MNLDGTDLVMIARVERPRAIVVDPCNGWVADVSGWILHCLWKLSVNCDCKGVLVIDLFYT